MTDEERQRMERRAFRLMLAAAWVMVALLLMTTVLAITGAVHVRACPVCPPARAEATP